MYVCKLCVPANSDQYSTIVVQVEVQYRERASRGRREDTHSRTPRQMTHLVAVVAVLGYMELVSRDAAAPGFS